MMNQNNKNRDKRSYITTLLLILLGMSFSYLLYDYTTEKFTNEPNTLSESPTNKQESQLKEHKGEKNIPDTANTIQAIKESKINSQKNTLKEPPTIQQEASFEDDKKEENILTTAQVIANLEHEFRKKASSIVHTFKSTSNDREGRHIGEKNERFDVVTYHQFDFS